MDDALLQLERRVARLERANRLLVAGLVILIAPALYGFALASSPAQDVIQARRIQLVDGDGRVRMDFVHDSAQTALYIKDEQGQTRVGAAHFAHGGSGFALHGPEAKGAAVLYLKNGASLTSYDEEGNPVWRVPRE